MITSLFKGNIPQVVAGALALGAIAYGISDKPAATDTNNLQAVTTPTPEASETTVVATVVADSASPTLPQVEVPQLDEPAIVDSPELVTPVANQSESVALESETAINPAEQRDNANKLLVATKEADSSLNLGPITGCLNQMRAFACPIIGAIPVLSDIAGVVSIELGISCPTISGA